jgi:hypothetical protein
MEELERIIKQLKLHKSEIEDRDSLRESIMQKIGSKNKKLDYLFGWTEIVWLRRSLAIASTVIVVVFIIQQLFVINRIDKLEDRMVSLNTEKILEYQRENVIANSALFTDHEKRTLADSIKVATDDLLELVKSYHDLQMKYENMLKKAKTDDTEINNQKL